MLVGTPQHASEAVQELIISFNSPNDSQYAAIHQVCTYKHGEVGYLRSRPSSAMEYKFLISLVTFSACTVVSSHLSEALYNETPSRWALHSFVPLTTDWIFTIAVAAVLCGT
eukprot:IDg12097t1